MNADVTIVHTCDYCNVTQQTWKNIGANEAPIDWLILATLTPEPRLGVDHEYYKQYRYKVVRYKDGPEMLRSDFETSVNCYMCLECQAKLIAFLKSLYVNPKSEDAPNRRKFKLDNE